MILFTILNLSINTLKANANSRETERECLRYNKCRLRNWVWIKSTKKLTIRCRWINWIKYKSFIGASQGRPCDRTDGCCLERRLNSIQSSMTCKQSFLGTDRGIDVSWTNSQVEWTKTLVRQDHWRESSLYSNWERGNPLQRVSARSYHCDRV